jgi:hypothetical protein
MSETVGAAEHDGRLYRGSTVALLETLLLVALFFVFAGDPPPSINEAHYCVLAKNFWQPDWCSNDLFVASAKPHVVFHATFGALTQLFSLTASAWIGRLIGWTMLAVALRGLTRAVCDRDYVCLIVAVIWIAGIDRFNLAGEWVVGGIEAKVPADAFTLAAMTQIAMGNWRRVWPLLGIASAFHVLVGGWTVVAAMLAYAIVGRRQSPPVKQFVPLLIGGAIAMLGLWPGIQMSAAADPQDAATAAKIYTYARLPHHLLPSSFPASWYVRHGALLIVMLTAAWPLRRDRRFAGLFWLAIGSIAIAAVGLLLGLLPPFAPGLAARLLRFYWFRATDSITPLTLALAVAVQLRGNFWVGTASETLVHTSRLRLWGRGIAFCVAVAAVVLVARSALQHHQYGIPIAGRFDTVTHRGAESIETQRRAFADWIAVCNWVRQTFPHDEIVITPRHQYTFKWYAQRAEVANWKDVPQDAESLVLWYKRFFEIYPQRLGTVRVTIRYPDLRRYRRQYATRFMIVDRRVVGLSIPLVRVYPQDDEVNATYAVYRLP